MNVTKATLVMAALLACPAVLGEINGADDKASVGNVADEWGELRVERLPDLNVARNGHSTFCVGGEVVVAGGHTSGFVPTATAEFYKDGAWHVMPMVYTHDMGTAVVMRSGRVVMFGGMDKELGIGQTFTVEFYEPSEHRFEGYGCMENKRSFPNTLELDSGRVIVSGNWYADDCIEVFDGSRQNSFVKAVAQGRSMPYILRTSRDNAIIFSSQNEFGARYDTILVDRLHGDAFFEPFLATWRPFCCPLFFAGIECFVGDEAEDRYVNLVQVMNSDSTMAILRLDGERFSILPTDRPIPMCSPWGQISYFSYLVADRRLKRAYMVGHGLEDQRLYVVGIDYDSAPARLTLLCSEPMDDICLNQAVLTADGDLMIAGGYGLPPSNFDPSATVLLLHLGEETAAAEDGTRSLPWMLRGLALLAAVAAGIVIGIVVRRRKLQAVETETAAEAPATDAEATEQVLMDAEELMVRIHELVVEQQQYLNPDLKLSDISEQLQVNRTYLSDCVKATCHCSFTQYVNRYRIEHAKDLLRADPDKKISVLCSEAGFSNATSFHRTFKAVTGVTPREYLAKL